MRANAATMLGLVLVAAVDSAAGGITPQMQARIDAQKKTIALWAADRVVVEAVKAQNEKGPAAGMDAAAWAAAGLDHPLVQSLKKSHAGVWLAVKVTMSDGLICEAFLNGAKGEKAAFVDKPSSYIHAGSPKFDVPMGGQQWQGTPELDPSSHSFAIQIATPVLDGGKPIGVLVVGLSVDQLSR